MAGPVGVGWPAEVGWAEAHAELGSPFLSSPPFFCFISFLFLFIRSCFILVTFYFSFSKIYT